MNNFGEKVTFIWSVADLLRDSFKRSKYPDVILPFTVLRRIDCVLEPTKPKVLEAHAKLKDKLDNLAPQLRRAAGYSFYNTSPYTFESLCGDAKNLVANLKSYINSFSDNMREVIEKFDLQTTIGKLDDAGLLFLVTERFKNIDLHPDKVSNLEMGYVFEELIRKFNEAMDENPGEHFTPREVIRLMVNLLLTRDKEALAEKHIVRTVYDCCCGSGGMLTIAKDRITEINPNADVHLFGQEVNPETFAVAKSDLFMKSADGRDAENIKFGSTLGKDQHADKTFDYLLTNPPFGKEWKLDQKAVEDEHTRGYAGRFGAGLPRISDGQLLFLQHLLGRMKEPAEGGSRVAIVMNGSPLFTGDAASGESEIRRWVLENDWLEAVVALPEQLFYNTGIPTYVWVLTNRKPKGRKGKVQLIDATAVWTPMRKSLGDKRREISTEQIGEITRLFETFRESSQCRIFKAADFGYRKVTVERPLRLNFQASPDRIEYTESGMNSTPEEKIGDTQTAEAFKRDEYRFLIVANKFQTGFDQPLLHTMYVDKKLGGVNAVQTLSRLNRTCPNKEETVVLDFANDAEEIQKAFEPYYDRTLLSQGTDPNLLYDLQARLAEYHVYTASEVNAFAAVWFDPKGTQDKLHAVLQPAVDRYGAAGPEEQQQFRSQMGDFVRLYSFLSQVVTFTDADLEKLYLYGRLLLRKLPVKHDQLPVEIQQNIDVDSYRVQQTSSGRIKLDRGTAELEPITGGSIFQPPPEEIEALSLILKSLNDRFGTDFSQDDKVFIQQLEEKLAGDAALEASVKVNVPENARLTFDHVANDKIQEMIDSNFKFYKQVTDDPAFEKYFLDWLFERYKKREKAAG